MQPTMIQEADLVALLVDRPAAGLRDVGTVVHIYSSNDLYEVAFVNANGDTVAVEMLKMSAPLTGSCCLTTIGKVPRKVSDPD